MVRSTGDGHLATFDGPTQAIRCAEALRADAETLGIEIRAGIHTGECELLDTDIGGIAVHIAARILGHAAPGEILVSRTIRDLIVGSGTGFEDRGNVELRGVPGSWQLLAIDRHGPRAGSAEAELVSTPTPGPRTAMRRSDRAVAVMAGGHRGSCAGWPASPRPPAADEQRCVEPRRGLRPHTVRNSDRCNVKAGRPRLASVSEAKTSFTKSVPPSAQYLSRRTGRWRDKQLPDGTIMWTSPTGRIYRTTPGGLELFPQMRPACGAPKPRKRSRSREKALRIARARSKIRDQRPVNAETRRINRARKQEIADRKWRNHMRKMLILFKGTEPSTSPWCTWVNDPLEPEELPPDWKPPPAPPHQLDDEPPF